MLYDECGGYNGECEDNGIILLAGKISLTHWLGFIYAREKHAMFKIIKKKNKKQTKYSSTVDIAGGKFVVNKINYF